MKNTSICIFSALGGALVGAAVAMLVTPQSGRELRGKLHEAFDDTARRIHDDLCRCKSSSEGEGTTRE
ncbi:MAG: YtxH domain-containing protein [Alistipes sp.]|nr:YtxH domain-containing protein [Alistipes sp.]